MWILVLSLLEGIAMSVAFFFIIYICMKMEGELKRLSVRDDLLSWIVCWSPGTSIFAMGYNGVIVGKDIIVVLAIVAFIAPVVVMNEFGKKKKEIEKLKERQHTEITELRKCNELLREENIRLKRRLDLLSPHQ